MTSRVVGDIPDELIGGGVQRAWARNCRLGRGVDEEWEHGVASVRGWARTGRKGEKGVREGYVTPLFQHLVQELKHANKHQYMFVAVHSEGEQDLRDILHQAGASVMLEVPDGRMGHREAWWPIDKYFNEAKDWAWKLRVPASSAKEAVWLVRLGRGKWIQEAAAGEQRQRAIRELEELGVQYVAGGLAGIQLRWGDKDEGRVLLGEDREYTREVGLWLGLVAAKAAAEEIAMIEHKHGIKADKVLEVQGSGDSVRKKLLGAEVQAFRQKGPSWLRCGVISTQADWVADKAVGMGRRKGQWLQAVVRSMQVMDAALEQKFRRAVQLWLQWRGVMSSAVPRQEGSYPCSCCRRWWKVVFVLGETGGCDATK